MGKFLRLVNGVPRSFSEANGSPIYDESVVLVASNPGPGEMLGPINTGVPVSLPNGESYVAEELEVYLNGQRQEDVVDFNFTSSTQVAFTFDLIVGDRIRWRIDRPAE
jgi:hypothetical protein